MENYPQDFQPNPSQGSISKKLMASFSGQIGIFAFGFISQVIIAQGLGAEGKGLFSLVLLIISLIYQISHGSLSASNLHFTGRFSSHGPGILGNSLVIALVAGGSITWLTFNYADKLIMLIYPNVDIQLVRITVFALTALYLLEYSNSIVRGQNRLGRFSFTLAAREFVFSLIVLILFLTNSLSVKHALQSWLTIAILVSVYAFWSAWSGMKFNLKLDLELWKRMAKYSAKAHTANLSSFLRMRLDMFLLALYLDVKTVGYYSITYALIQFLTYLPKSVGQVLGPHIAWRKDSAGNTLSPILCRISLFISAVAGAGLIAIGYPAIKLIFGEEFIPAYFPLIVTVPGAVVYTLAISLAGDLSGRGKPQYAMKISLLMLFVSLAANMSLIPTFGMIGAALASSITQAITGVLFFGAFLKESKVPMLSALIIRHEDFILIFGLLKKIRGG